MLEMLRQLCTLAQLHRQLLPHQIPQRQGWQVAVHYSASLWPGGDYYDFLSFADGRLLFLLAAANGQDAASTALALMVRVVLHSSPLGSGVKHVPIPHAAPSTQSPHLLLGHLNRVLAENKLEEQSMTAFCGVLDPVDGSLSFANAGHPSLRWWRASHRTVEAVRGVYGPPLGIDNQAFYQPQAIWLEPGDLLVLYSNNLTPTPNRNGQRFGWELLDDVLRETAPRGAEAVKSAVLARLDASLASKDFPNEVTLIVIERQKENRIHT